MTAITPPTITLLFAAALGLLNLWLSIRTGMLRVRGKASIGDGGDPLLLARMRAHANFVEYVPMALILMALIELIVGHSTILWAVGSLLVVGRLIHPFGMERAAPNPFRVGGILITYLVTLGLVGWGIWIAFHSPAHVTYL